MTELFVNVPAYKYNCLFFFIIHKHPTTPFSRNIRVGIHAFVLSKDALVKSLVGQVWGEALRLRSQPLPDVGRGLFSAGACAAGRCRMPAASPQSGVTRGGRVAWHLRSAVAQEIRQAGNRLSRVVTQLEREDSTRPSGPVVEHPVSCRHQRVSCAVLHRRGATEPALSPS